MSKSALKTGLLLCILSLGVWNASAQYDSVQVTRPNGLNYRFYYAGIRADSKFVKVLVESDKQALKWAKRGNRKNGWSALFFNIGGFLIGWNVTDLLINEGEFPLFVNTPIGLGIGAGCIGIGLGINRWSNQNTYKGVLLWNEHLREEKSAEQQQFQTRSDLLPENLNNNELDLLPENKISEEELSIRELSAQSNLEYEVYLKQSDVQIGDYVLFRTKFDEEVFGVVAGFEEKLIEINTYPSEGNKLIQKLPFDQLRKVITTNNAINSDR